MKSRNNVFRPFAYDLHVWYGSFGDPSRCGTLDTAGGTRSERTTAGMEVDIDRPEDYDKAVDLAAKRRSAR